MQQPHNSRMTQRTSPAVAGSLTSLAAGAVVLVLAGCASGSSSAAHSSAASAPEAPPTISIEGSLAVTDPDGGAHVEKDGTITVSEAGGPCYLYGGYSDIAAGASVVISDDGGTTLAITKLEPGSFSKGRICTFHFAATVPTGRHFYGVTVTHRGTVKFSEADVRHPALTLGG